MRTINLDLNAKTAFGGYQGEHNATTVVYDLPDNFINANYTYTVDIEIPDGTTVSTIINNYKLPFTAALTALAGTIKLQLSIANSGKLIQKSSVVQISIYPSLIPNSTILCGDGTSIQSAGVNADGHLILTLTDDTIIDCGNVVGPQGPQGLPGADGKDYVITDADKVEIAQLVKNTVKTVPDTILTAGTEYYLGEQENIELAYPPNAQLGDCIYVNFKSGIIPTVVTGSNCIGLESFLPSANAICEIHAQYNGQWVCLTCQTGVSAGD